MLSGDLNDLQQMALLSLMTDETDESKEQILTLLRSMVIAVHGDPKKIIDMLDEGVSSNSEMPEFASEMSEEEMEEYQPYSEEEVAQTIDLLRKFGVAVS